MQGRFFKLDASAALLPAQTTDHSIVAEPARGLQWSARLLCDGERVPHREALAAATRCRLGGFRDWRLPTVEELFLLADRRRHNPPIDTDAFPDTPRSLHWTSTVDAEYPEFAWGVTFRFGGSDFGHRTEFTATSGQCDRLDRVPSKV